MNDIVAKTENLPTGLIDQIAEGLAKSFASQTSSARGHTLLKLDRAGLGWVFGIDNEPVQDGSRWWVNVGTFKHGLVVWSESKIVYENMVDGWMEAPPPPANPHPTGQPYKVQRSVELRCLNGEDKDLEVLYKISSDGGNERLGELGKLAGVRIAQFGHSHGYLYPVIELEHESYPNKTHGGRTYKPILTLVGWADIDGNMEGEAGHQGAAKLAAPAAEAAAAKPVKPAKPAKTSLRAVPDQEAVEPLPAQRRRPGR